MRLVEQAARSYSVRNRRRKAARIVRFMDEHAVRSVLLVGTESADYDWSNIVERAVMEHAGWIVASGLGPDLDVPAPRVICDGRRLPFDDDSFDLVISNAVVEHVGSQHDQAAFVAEHHRVGRAFIITTPNLWYPVESHTRTVLRHWSARWRTARAEFTRLLSRRLFRAILPPGTAVEGWAASPTFTATHVCGPGCEGSSLAASSSARRA